VRSLGSESSLLPGVPHQLSLVEARSTNSTPRRTGAPHRLIVAISRAQPQGPPTIASAPVDLTTLGGFCISDTEQDPPFGILSRIFTGQGGISGTREETWVYRMLWKMGVAL
jgi:hypothetical protein